MKLSDLKSKFKDQWVLAKVTKTDEYGQALEVEPIDHADKKSTITKKLVKTDIKHVTVVYTGDKKAQI